MNKVIVTESYNRRDVVDWYVKKCLNISIQIINAGGYSGALSSIRSLLVRGESDILYLCSLNGATERDNQLHLDEVKQWIESVPSSSTVKIVTLPESLEATFFPSLQVMEDVLSRPVKPMHYKAYKSAEEPYVSYSLRRGVLKELFAQDSIQIRTNRYLVNNPILKEIQDFVKD